MKGYARSETCKKWLKDIKGGLATSKTCEIHILADHESKGLIVLGEQISIVGSFAIVFHEEKGKPYTVFNSLAMYRINPESMRTDMIDDKAYYVFTIAKDSLVITSDTILINGDKVYPSLSSYSFYGRIPWFYSYKKSDLTKLYLTATEHTGLRIDEVPSIIMLLSAIQARDKNNTERSIRHLSNYTEDDIKHVPLINHTEGVTHNFSRITNAYQADGMLAAVSKDEVGETTLIERVARA